MTRTDGRTDCCGHCVPNGFGFTLTSTAAPIIYRLSDYQRGKKNDFSSSTMQCQTYDYTICSAKYLSLGPFYITKV